MDRLSASEIKDYINPRAFQVSRSSTSPKNVTDSTKNIVTGSISESYSLVTAATNRLSELFFNLNTLRDLATEGAQSRLNDRDYDRIIGSLRSLTAGFDQVVDASQFNSAPLFDGRDLELSLGGTYVDLEMGNMHLFGEESLGLVKRAEGGRVDIGYDPETIIRNQNSGLSGLDIADAVGIERTDGLPELEDGKYKIELVYEGPDSKIILTDQFGAKIETKEGVDLSGSGTEIVKMDSGIQFTIEKQQLLESIDKYPYETLGSVSLFADMEYTQIYSHELEDGEETSAPTSTAEWLYKPNRNYGDSALNVLDIETAGISELAVEMKEGNYRMSVDYNGADSVVSVRDINGRLIMRKGSIDLSETGKHTVNLGVGVKVTLENRGLTTETKQTNATFKYEPAEEYTRDFDFKDYITRIDAAMNTVNEQLNVLEDAQARIEQSYRYQQGNFSSAGANSGAAVISMLASSGAGNSLLGLLGGGGVNAQLGVTASQIFSYTSGAASAQGSGIPLNNVLLL